MNHSIKKLYFTRTGGCCCQSYAVIPRTTKYLYLETGYSLLKHMIKIQRRLVHALNSESETNQYYKLLLK
jgi:hypothetical protein